MKPTVIYEFLPDGTFNATPPGSTTVVDKDKYEVLDEGRTVKLRSQLFKGEASVSWSTMPSNAKPTTGK